MFFIYLVQDMELTERYFCETDNFIKYLFTVWPSSGEILGRSGKNVRTVIIPKSHVNYLIMAEKRLKIVNK